MLMQVASLALGAVLGVVVDKIVGDAFLAGKIPNPQIGTIQMHDILLIVAELGGAWVLRGRTFASRVLVGMALGVIVTDVYEYVANTGAWF